MCAGVAESQGQDLSIPNQPVYDSVLSGEYRGNVVDAQGLRHQITVRIIAFQDGTCSASYDVPDMQLVNRIFTVASNEMGRILLVDEKADATFEGQHDFTANAIDGMWNQQRTKVAVRFTKTTFSPTRSQEPGTNVPYVSSPIAVNNRLAGVTLNGTLILPDRSGTWPLLIFVSDRGTQDRDATDHTGHRPFLVMADFFARNKWASLRIDDRSVNNVVSANQSLDDLSTDIVSTLDRIKSEKNIDPQRIVIIGHGEGGLVALLAAEKRPGLVSAIVLASTPAITGERLLPEMIAESERLYGTDEDVISEAVSIVRIWMSIARESPSVDEAVLQIGKATDKALSEHSELLTKFPTAVRLSKPDRDVYIKETLLPLLNSYNLLDPTVAVSNIRKPCYVLIAERDAIVPSRINLPAWQSLDLPAISETRLIVGVNHGFQSCTECTVEEARESRETVKPEVLSDILLWINRATAR